MALALACAIAAGCSAPPAAGSTAPASHSAGGASAAPASHSAGGASAARPALNDSVVTREARVEDLQLVTGELKAVRSLTFATPRSEAWALQIKWLAEDGTEVKEGGRVIEFDNTAIAQGREEKNLRLVQAGIDLASREAALAAERVEHRFALDSAHAGVEKAGIDAAVPADLRQLREWQQKQAALTRAEASEQKAKLALDDFEIAAHSDLEILRIAKEKAEREVESVERDLSALQLTAPRTGIFAVAEHPWEGRKMQVGDTVWPGMDLAWLPDLSEMEVVGILPEVDEGRIGAGMPVRCVLDTYPDRVFEGRLTEVSVIGKEPDRRTVGGFNFRAKLDDSDPSVMRPGMSVRVEVIRRVWENVLTVPRQRLRTEEGKTWATGPSGERIEVRLAGCTPTRCVVEEGLREGDRIAAR